MPSSILWLLLYMVGFSNSLLYPSGQSYSQHTFIRVLKGDCDLSLVYAFADAIGFGVNSKKTAKLRANDIVSRSTLYVFN